MQETHWRCSTSSRKIWWLDNRRSQGGQWISKQSQICCRGAGFGRFNHTLAKQKHLRKQKGLTKVLGADAGTKSHLPWQFPRIWKSLWRLILVSLFVNASPFRDKWYCWKSGTQNKGRDVCSIAAIRSGWKMVGGFHGMLLLSAKHSRPHVWWEKLFTNFGSANHFKGPIIQLVRWSNITLFLPKTCRDSTNSVRKSYVEYSSGMSCMRRESRRETFWSQTLTNWERWTHQKSMLGDSMQRKCCGPEMVNTS